MPKIYDMIPDNVSPVAPSTSLMEVARQMLETGNAIIPVTNHGSYLGVVTQKDIIVAITRADYDIENMTAGSTMSSLPVILSSDDFWQAANLMVETGYSTLVVLDQGKLYGLFTLEALAREQPPLAGMVYASVNKTIHTHRGLSLAHN